MAVAAAQKLGRNWLGIDIVRLAAALMKNRLKTVFDILFAGNGRGNRHGGVCPSHVIRLTHQNREMTGNVCISPQI